MWVSALDLLLARMQAEGFAFGRVAAVSGSGQQHGSVYWGGAGEALLAGMGGDAPLAAQLKDAFAHHASPIWADSSTSVQCSALEAAMGSPQTVATVTGSRAYERFTGNQIAKISETFPEAYAATARVSLVSSFMSSIFLGRIAPIDLSDGSGMNLLDIRSRDWSGDALAAHAGAADLAAGLASRLGPVVPSHAVLGTIHGYFQGKFGFPASCALVAWSGDNPCSMAGLGLEAAGDIAISLGTSDTMFGVTADPKPGLEGHIFVSPVDPTSYMAMLCYKNGSLAREAIRDQHQAALAAALDAGGGAEGDVWAGFNAALERTPAGNQGNIGFYHFAPEITPNTGDRSGVYRFAYEDMARGTGSMPVDAFEDAAVDVRALVEGQFLSMRVHSEAVGINDPKRIVVTGGASQNTNIVQVT
jgi:xylulokinase